MGVFMTVMSFEFPRHHFHHDPGRVTTATVSTVSRAHLMTSLLTMTSLPQAQRVGCMVTPVSSCSPITGTA